MFIFGYSVLGAMPVSEQQGDKDIHPQYLPIQVPKPPPRWPPPEPEMQEWKSIIPKQVPQEPMILPDQVPREPNYWNQPDGEPPEQVPPEPAESPPPEQAPPEAAQVPPGPAESPPPNQVQRELSSSDSDDIKKKYLALRIEQLEQQIEGTKYNQALLAAKTKQIAKIYEIRNDAFDMQWWFGIVSLVAVHLLLVVGVGLAIYESIKGGRLNAPLAMATQEELKIGLKGLSIKSSFLSILFLGITLAFYFLYIKYIFPISEV
jgi:hypothetical protein